MNLSQTPKVVTTGTSIGDGIEGSIGFLAERILQQVACM